MDGGSSVRPRPSRERRGSVPIISQRSRYLDFPRVVSKDGFGNVADPCRHEVTLVQGGLMELHRLISRFRIMSSLVAALLFATLTASPRPPDGPKADDRAPAPGDLRGLQEQI